MVLRTRAGIRTGEDTTDLCAFLHALPGGPPVHETVLLGCDRHGDERPAWAYVEADASAGVARRRCLRCASAVEVLDSAARWTYPPTWSCRSCSQSIVELAAGLSGTDPERVGWVVLAARCVECGRIEGLTDLLLPDLPLPEVLARL